MHRFLAAKQHWALLRLVLLAAVSLTGPLSSARADVTPAGDVSPSNPSGWTSSTTGYVGGTAGGTVTVNGDSDLLSYVCSIGDSKNSTGVVTVDGSGSTWTNSFDVYIGNSGDGEISITNRGGISALAGHIGCNSGSTGIVAVDGAGSTWTSTSLDVGESSGGTLLITGGGSVNTSYNRIGANSGSRGVATVNGSGSTWTTNTLYVGDSGNGAVSIVNRGSVSSGSGYLGFWSGSAGTVTVDGAGSTWTNTGGLEVGYYGSGTLSITGGGAVTAATVSINSTSLLAIDVGRGSSLAIGGGAGTLINSGAIRILAGAGVPAGAATYSPISAGSWAGAGTYQAVGGTWSATNRKFTASSVIAGTSSVPISLDRNLVQRVLIDDNGTGGTHWQLGASFLAAGTTSDIVFTATAASGSLLDLLKTAAGNHTVSSAWTFSTTGYTLDANDPIYFSLKVGPNPSTDDLELWGYNGTFWAAYVPTDLTYDGTYASFTATGLSGFAAVPEPGTLVLFAAGFLGFAAFARRKWFR